MFVSNLPPKHRFLQKYSNELKSRLPQQKTVGTAQGPKTGSLILQETGDTLSYVPVSEGSTSTSTLTLKKLFTASLEIQKRNSSISPMTPCSPSDDIPPTYYLQARKVKRESPSNPTESRAAPQKIVVSSAGSSQEETQADIQPHCCLFNCRKPVNNRLRHSLKTYTVEDCDPIFVSKKYDKVCNFHYFRDNYLYRKLHGKGSPGTEDDSNKENVEASMRRERSSERPKAILEGKESLKRKRESETIVPLKKKRAGNHDEEFAKD